MGIKRGDIVKFSETTDDEFEDWYGDDEVQAAGITMQTRWEVKKVLPRDELTDALLYDCTAIYEDVAWSEVFWEWDIEPDKEATAKVRLRAENDRREEKGQLPLKGFPPRY